MSITSGVNRRLCGTNGNHSHTGRRYAAQRYTAHSNNAPLGLSGSYYLSGNPQLTQGVKDIASQRDARKHLPTKNSEAPLFNSNNQKANTTLA